MSYNEFNRDLKYSEETGDDKIINDFYRRKFPNLVEIKTIKGKTKEDIALQKAGIDKIIILKNGKEINIDEKKRRKDYGDILLEEWSVLHMKKKGWTGDPAKKTDYITYIILPANNIYLFPYDLLQLTWRTNHYKWREIYGIKKAFNHGYVTTNIAVPLDTLLDALKAGMCHKAIPEPGEEAIFEDKFFFDKEAGRVKDNFESLGSIITRTFKRTRKRNNWQEKTLFSKFIQPELF